MSGDGTTMANADYMARLRSATHGYLIVYDGICKGICVDMGDESTAEFVAEGIKAGGHVYRAPIAVAQTALFEPWPRQDGGS